MRLWLEDKVTLTELQSMSIDDVETANRWLNAIQAAKPPPTKGA